MTATMSVINRHTSISTQLLTASRIGNILSKTGLGSYTYGSSKPHAVTEVENTGGIIPQTPQDITYNAFGKVSRIESGGYTLDIDYGSDRQRWRSTVTDSLGNIVRSIRYCEDEELVTIGDSTLVVLYIDGGIVYVRGKNSPQSSSRFYQITADRLGSVLNLSDNQGNKIFTRSYDAWGKPGNWSHGWFQHGYTGHEMLPEFGLINMNGRVYDPVQGRFLSPDDYVQMPLSPQGFNRYTYCNNNPLKYTDPSGEVFGLAAIVGAVIGTYIGGSIANGTYNPTKWDFSSGKTWGYMVGGGLIGAASGHVGAAIMASNTAIANTIGIIVASTMNSLGTYAYTLGNTPLSVSMGAFSYDFSNHEFGYLGKKGNSWLENWGYFSGLMANISDTFTMFKGGGNNIKGNSASIKDHWWGHFSITDDMDNALVSIGPDSEVEKPSNLNLSQLWKNSIKNAKNWDTYVGKKGTLSIELNNISTNAINKYVSGITRWDLLLNSCVGHASRALWCAGVPNIYLFHPHLLYTHLLIRQLGIYSTPFIYHINHLNQ